MAVSGQQASLAAHHCWLSHTSCAHYSLSVLPQSTWGLWTGEGLLLTWRGLMTQLRTEYPGSVGDGAPCGGRGTLQAGIACCHLVPHNPSFSLSACCKVHLWDRYCLHFVGGERINAGLGWRAVYLCTAIGCSQDWTSLVHCKRSGIALGADQACGIPAAPILPGSPAGWGIHCPTAAPEAALLALWSSITLSATTFMLSVMFLHFKWGRSFII